jgi:hypothetical protein
MNTAIILDTTFSVHVRRHRGGPVDMARCHVRRRDGSAETAVGLPLLDVIAGPGLSREERLVLLHNLQLVLDEWERING